MKLSSINPTKLFKPKKTRSVSKSEPDHLSFGSQTTSSSSGLETPKSVLPCSSSSIDAQFELKQAFQLIDLDKDGKVKKEELEALLIRLGSSDPRGSDDDLKLMLNEVDRDGDGCISLEEFYAIGSAFEPPTCDSEIRSTFDFFDTDRDGKITAEELFRVFETIGDLNCTLEDCRRMIEGVDRNGDGFVCFEDFSRMMEHQQR